jgi:hypothetical protein
MRLGAAPLGQSRIGFDKDGKVHIRSKPKRHKGDSPVYVKTRINTKNPASNHGGVFFRISCTTRTPAERILQTAPENCKLLIQEMPLSA